MNSVSNVVLDGSLPGVGQMGKGGRQVVQQGVNIKTVHDRAGALTRVADINSRRGMFQVNDQRMFQVQENMLLYYFSDLPNYNNDGERATLPCLNGAGKVIDELYKDPEVRRLALRSIVHFGGIAIAGFNPYLPDAPTSHTLQIHGTRSILFDGEIPPGAFVQMEVPLETDFSRGKYTPLISRAEGQVAQARCIVTRYDPKTISNRFVTARNAVLADPDKFARAFNPLGGNGLDDAFKTFFNSQLASLLLGFYCLYSDMGRMNLIRGGLVEPAPNAPAAVRAQHAVEVCNRLAVGLGLAQANSSSKVSLTTLEKSNFDNLKQQLLNTVNWTGLINCAYAATPLQKNSINSLNQIDRRPEFSPIESQIAALAYNHGQQAVAAYNQFVEWDTRPIIGICTKGARAGEYGEILITY